MFENSQRHILLISGSSPDSKSVAAVMSLMRMANAVPMLVSNHADRVEYSDDPEIIKEESAKDLSKADGIIVMGNDLDIDPADYRETNVHPKTTSERNTQEGNVRAEYEYKLIEGALESKLPLLAICGGMQRVNVLLGGNPTPAYSRYCGQRLSPSGWNGDSPIHTSPICACHRRNIIGFN